MKNLEQHVLQKEAKFDLHELFFSITQDDSTIVSGNETFVRISGYERDELVGQHHNIIRHPDMPRVVFKVFWDYLKANRPIAAYVKNRTKQGGFYWVFAVVFPLGDRYVSIRIKPNTQIFSAVKDVYSKLLESQSSLNMQDSQLLTLELLNSLGYKDYDHFMNEALVLELLSRKKLLLNSKSSDDEYFCLKSEFHIKIESLYCSSKTLMQRYAKWFEKIEAFNKIKLIFEEKSVVLSSLARDIVFLSLNASVASYRVDTYGETFGVLASDIRINAKENDALIKEIHNLSQSLSESLNKIIFFVSSISLQMEMVTYFLKELFKKNNEELSSNVYLLFELVHSYNKKLTELTTSMDEAIYKSIIYLNQLEQQILYLGYVQVYGIIESARYNDDSSGFGEIFLQLKTLIKDTSEEILVMKKIGESFFRDNRMLINESKDIEKMLYKLENEILNIKNIEG